MPRRAGLPPRPDDPWALTPWPWAPWSTLELVAVALMPFGLVYFSEVVALGLFGVTGTWVGVLLTLVQQLSMGLLVAVWVRRRYGSIAPLGLRRRASRGADIGAGIGAGVGAVFAGGAVIQATESIVRAIAGSAPAPVNPLVDYGGSWRIVTVGMALVLAPVCEEILFRGFLFGGLRRRLRFRWAALGSAIPFALLHGDPIRILGLAVMGVILAGVYERRRTLVASMSAHATLNTISVLVWLASTHTAH